jgi:hypothetical protein
MAMSDAPEFARTHDLNFSVTLSAEPAFAETAGALAARAGDFAGCPADDARRLGEAVREAFARLAATATAAQHLQLVVQGSPRLVRIDLCCSAAEAGAGLEARLEGPESAEPIQSLVDRVEFGTAHDAVFCRFTQQVRPTR